MTQFLLNITCIMYTVFKMGYMITNVTIITRITRYNGYNDNRFIVYGS